MIYNEKSQWVKNEATLEFQRLVLPTIDTRTFLSEGNVICESLGFGITVEAQIEYQRIKGIPYAIPWIITYCVNSLYLLPSGMSFFLPPGSRVEEVVADMYQDVKKYPTGTHSSASALTARRSLSGPSRFQRAAQSLVHLLRQSA
jgi:hypothetical protein